MFYQKVRCSEHAKVDEVTSTLKRKQTVRNPVGVISDMQGCEEALRVPQINVKKPTGRRKKKKQDASEITSGLTCDAFDILPALFLFGEMRAGFIHT